MHIKQPNCAPRVHSTVEPLKIDRYLHVAPIHNQDTMNGLAYSYDVHVKNCYITIAGMLLQTTQFLWAVLSCPENSCNILLAMYIDLALAITNYFMTQWYYH